MLAIPLCLVAIMDKYVHVQYCTSTYETNKTPLVIFHHGFEDQQRIHDTPGPTLLVRSTDFAMEVIDINLAVGGISLPLEIRPILQLWNTLKSDHEFW